LGKRYETLHKKINKSKEGLGHGSNGPTSVRHKFQKRKSKKKEILKIFSQILKKYIN
jgi:hypothetical protein